MGTGVEIIPSLLSFRCLCLFLLIISMTIYSCYTSVLVSTLIKSDSNNKIDSIKALADSQMKIGFEEIPYMHSFLNVSTKIGQKERDKKNETKFYQIFLLVNKRPRTTILHRKKSRFEWEKLKIIPKESRRLSAGAARKVCIPLWSQYRLSIDKKLVHTPTNLRSECFGISSR